MLVSVRVLMLVVPLTAFAVGGSFYQPPEGSGNGLYGSSGSAMSQPPSLPAWANKTLPDFTNYRDTKKKKAAFFSYIYPRIVLANSRILIARDYLESLADKDTLSDQDHAWLDTQARHLKVKAESGSPEQLAALNKQLDIIPPSLVMAQAANESAWGTSRFATRGNNLFGQWCFTAGCGIVPQHRPEGATHEVAAFSSPYQSIKSYIRNLNRHDSYKGLREVRFNDRKAGKSLSGSSLAQGLKHYSERGEEYVNEIRSMISYNNLEFYDNEFRKILSNRSPSHLKELASASAGQALLPDNSDSASAEG